MDNTDTNCPHRCNEDRLEEKYMNNDKSKGNRIIFLPKSLYYGHFYLFTKQSSLGSRQREI